MAADLTPGLTPAEIAFLSEMELVTVVPRQRLEALHLLGGPTVPLVPPIPANLPLWLALLLKRQRRADIRPPSWLSTEHLSTVLAAETSSPDLFVPTLSEDDSHPSHKSSSAAAFSYSTPSSIALPYHWLSISALLLADAADDIQDPESVRRLVRDVREARAAKVRRGTEVLEAASEVRMDGVAALEVASEGGFIRGVVDGLRVIGSSKEVARREKEVEEEGGVVGAAGGGGRGGTRRGARDATGTQESYEDEDDDML